MATAMACVEIAMVTPTETATAICSRYRLWLSWLGWIGLLRWAGRTFGSQSNSVADLVSGLKRQGYSNVQVQSRSYSSDNLPENIEEFIRSATSGGAPGSTQKQQDLSARLSELQEAQKAGLISDEEYEAKRKEILDEF